MPKADQVSLRGKVIKALPNTRWEVEILNGQVIQAYLGGKLRQNHIMIMPGDEVDLELSPYDLLQARIIYRIDNRKKPIS